MSKDIDSIYEQLNTELKAQNIGITAAELHGVIAGLLAGGNKDESWQPLLFDMANDGQTFSSQLMDLTQQIYQDTKQQLDDDEFEFQLLISDRDLFTEIDDLIGWVNHFLLGLGLMQPHLSKVKGDTGEAIADLRQITKLGYEEDDDQEELAYAFEEVLEYVRVSVILCHDEFADNHASTTLH